MGNEEGHSATELDSHANMIVIGGHCLEISDSGTTAQVSSFSKEAGEVSDVRIIDAVCAYDCPKTGRAYLLVMRNGLHVPSNEHNLIPPFIMREAGLVVKDTPKIHCQEATVEDHTVYCKEHDLRIPLSLDGIFSYFPTRALTIEEMEHPEELPYIFLSPDTPRWDPYDERFEEYESSFTDPRGDLAYPMPREQDELITTGEVMHCDEIGGAIAGVESERPNSQVTVDESESEAKQIQAVISSSAVAMDVMDRDSGERARDSMQHLIDDDIRTQVAETSVVLDPHLFAAKISAAIAQSKFSEAIGATLVNDDGCELWAAAEPSTQDAEVSSSRVGKVRGVSPEILSKVFKISHEEAANTIKVTTQYNKQDADSSVSRRFGTNDRDLRYRRINTYFFTDTFYVTKKARSKPRGFIGVQLFVSDLGFVYVVPIKAEKEFPKALKLFAKEVGVPTAIIADPARAQKSNEVVQFCHKIGTSLRLLEESTQWANRAELYVGLIKEAVRKDLRESNAPLVFWDFAVELRARMFNVTAKNLFQLQGETPHMRTLGTQPDISNICQFVFYEWVYYRDGSASFPLPAEALGRYLGLARNHGNEMTKFVLTRKGQVVPRTTVRRLTPAEQHSVSEKAKRDAFDVMTRMKFGNSFTLPDPLETIEEETEEDLTFDPIEDGEEGSPDEDPDEPRLVMPEADSAVDDTGKLISTNSIADAFITMEVLLPNGEEKQLAQVLRRSLDENGRHVGRYNDNPVLNTAVYDVEFPDGTIKAYGANIIAENVLQSVDEDGYHSQFLEGILDHKKDASLAVSKDKRFVTSKAGNRHLRKTTTGWKFKIKWRDGSTEWVPLKILKESNPVETAVYAKSRGLIEEPAFAWWVPFVLRKRDRIIAAVNSRVRKVSHKYGIEIPTSTKHAIQIDRRNHNTDWQDALGKEMKNVGIAFKILEDDEVVPVGYTKSSGHLIFDVKMDFTRKARWVKDGHKTPNPDTSSYAGVVSRESIRIMLTHAALHGLDVYAADIQNAYLQAPTSEKHYIICGDEFGAEHVGKRAIITRALYGGKCAGRDFWHHLRSCMKHLEFESSRGDPDVWYREAERKNGDKYYEYVLLYTDDCLVISERARSVLEDEIGHYFDLKEESIGPPSKYLGGKLRHVELENGTKCWAFGSAQYCKAAVENVEAHLKNKEMSLVNKASTPLSSGYRLEVDITPELGSTDAAYYHSMIGVLRWIVELGRADLATEVSMMSSHLALPREGHLKEVFHIFAYLKKHHNAEMVFDPSEPEMEMDTFPRQD